MLKDLLKPHVQLGSFLLRLGLAWICIFHGYLKLTAHDGTHWDDQLPEATQLAVSWGELVCGFALLFGLLSRVAAIGIIVIQVGAIVLQTAKWDFINTDYIKSYPYSSPTGAEYNFVLIMMCLALLALGSGKVSLDHLFCGRRQSGTD
jgi:uncharacterized membrane protein YphA (DoxX/SURF4 family)